MQLSEYDKPADIIAYYDSESKSERVDIIIDDDVAESLDLRHYGSKNRGRIREIALIDYDADQSTDICIICEKGICLYLGYLEFDISDRNRFVEDIELSDGIETICGTQIVFEDFKKAINYPESEGVFNNWQDAYKFEIDLEHIREQSSGLGNNHYELAYINEDSIPELIAFISLGETFFSFDLENGQIKRLSDEASISYFVSGGTYNYVPYKNIVYFHDFHGWINNADILRIDEDYKFRMTMHGEAYLFEDANRNKHFDIDEVELDAEVIHVNGIPLSESEYNTFYGDYESSTALIGAYDYNEIIDEIGRS